MAAGLAVAAPHLLFPDPDLQRLHLVNPEGSRLLRHQIRRWRPVLAALSVPPAVLAVGGGVWLVAEGALAAWGVGLYALARTLPLGLHMQLWERGEAGTWYRTLQRRAPPVSFSVPDPLVPGLLLTAEVFLVEAVIAVAGQAAGSVGALVAAAVLLAVAGMLLARQSDAADRLFWASNGTWADAFHLAGTETGRAPLTYSSVYWAPPPIRPAVWAGLVSLDRRLPLGRIAAAGLAVVATVYIVDAPAGVRLAMLALWTVGVNGAVALTATDALLPVPLAYRLHGAVPWMLTRFLINVRWLPPFVLTLALLVLLTDRFTWGGVLGWTFVYLFVAALAGCLATLAARFRFRRAVA